MPDIFFALCLVIMISAVSRVASSEFEEVRAVRLRPS
jgi:hypothetical protein